MRSAPRSRRPSAPTTRQRTTRTTRCGRAFECRRSACSRSRRLTRPFTFFVSQKPDRTTRVGLPHLWISFTYFVDYFFIVWKNAEGTAIGIARTSLGDNDWHRISYRSVGPIGSKRSSHAETFPR